MKTPWHAWLLLLRPNRVRAHLQALVQAGVIGSAPTLWQIELGVLRMWHRVLFRSETVGTCADHSVRPTLRARLLAWRPFRAPFLFAERAIAPLDHSGLAQPAWRMVRHLLAAHHDRNQFAYDLEILRGNRPVLEAVRDQAAAVVDGTSPRARWLRDLVVFDGYHEALLAAVDKALADEPLVDPDELDDPDITFDAYIRWCLAQPPTPAATWAAWRQRDFPRPVSS